MDERTDNLLRSYYYNVENPSAFSSASKLYQTVNAEGKKIGYHKITRWLNAQDNYSLQKTPRRSFKRLRVYTTGIGNLLDADLMEMQNISEENDGFKYILIVIDVFSRYLWMEATKSKSAVDVGKAFKKILQKIPKVEKVRTDKDRCFLSKYVQQLFKEKGIRHFVAENEKKANYSERVLQTIRNKMFRYFTKKRNHRYIDDLQKFALSYNTTKHRSLNLAPAQVTRENEADVWAHQYLSKKVKKVKPKTENDLTKTLKKRRPWKVYKFKIGSLVRISHTRHIFERSYSEKWTEEIFKVKQRYKRQNINLYKLSDINGEELIKGSFYESELQRVDKDENSLWIVEKILKKRKRRGKTEYLCKFQGWPKKYNQYIPEEDIKTIT